MFSNDNKIPVLPTSDFTRGLGAVLPRWAPQCVRNLGRRRVYELCDDIGFQVRRNGFVIRVVIRRGKRTDLASVPFFLWWIFPPSGSWARASIVHDKLCDDGFDRELTDAIFRYAMKVDGVSFFARQVIYAGVRVYAIFYNTTKRFLKCLKQLRK